jgi:ATP/ADP translocase
MIYFFLTIDICWIVNFLPCTICSNLSMLQMRSVIPPANERKKLIPLAMMFFCILFNYTILRDTKDVLMVTAPKSGAEVIPFIKTYVNLPVAIVS